MAKRPRSHYSPKFANKAWADGNGYTSYFRSYSSEIMKEPKGWKEWGREKGLYSWSVETSLDNDLETYAIDIYKKICSFNELNNEERIIWSQFLLSQLVRTPTYMAYENTVCELQGITDKPKHDRVGCKECGDLVFVANRDWCLLVAHEDDYFVRSDNPVFQTGFIELPDTCLFYPLTPKLCFVACSMDHDWDALSNKPNETVGYELDKGAAHFYNFHLATAAGKSLIISPEHDGEIAGRMYKDVLGIYPQPPFLLYILDNNAQSAFESIRKIMSVTDNKEYPQWQPMELEPFYQIKRL